MSARVLFTVGGMAINARHRRDVEPAYRTGEDAGSLAECTWEANPFTWMCPECFPSVYAKRHAKHRAEVAA